MTELRRLASCGLCAIFLRLQDDAIASRNSPPANPTMPPLRIPPRYQPGIRALTRLSEAQVEPLTAALQETPDRLSTEYLARRAAEAVPDLADDAFDVVDALLSLIALLDDDGSMVEELARDVASSQDVELDEAVRDAFAATMVRLLRLRPLVVAARAHDLMAENERVFHDARVFTDIRPVFGPDAREGPRAALLVSTLKIDWHPTDGSTESAFYALDRSDLQRLRDVVDRALDKAASLEGVIGSAALPYWQYREPDEEDADATET